jgi:c-di-GMP-binding flagellar brake protein YcgR
MTPASGRTLPGTLAPNATVLVRVGNQHDREYTSRIEDVGTDAITINSPTGASAALLASGSREVDLSWLSPRGRYEQRCVVVEHASGSQKQWRLRPVRRAVLVQRRRYLRVAAQLPVQVVLEGNEVDGRTVDVSEGGFRVRLPRQVIPELADTTVVAQIGGVQVAVSGYVLRTTDAPANTTDAVIAFDASAGEVEAIRRFVLNAQLRARAARDTRD